MFIKRIAAIIVLMMICCAALYAQDESAHHMLVKVMPETPERLQELFQYHHLDLCEGETYDTPHLFAYPEDIDLLIQLGYPYEILHEDVESFYADRIGNTPLTLMGGYKTYAEIVAELDSIHAAHPDITTAKFSIGNSLQGRPLWVMKISDNPNIDENEPEVFYNTLTHPREIVTMEVLFHFMHHITDNYGTDAEVTEIINGRELYFLPCVNPDGHEHNRTTNPNGGGLWRKNRRNNGNGTFGVDIARNYGFTWGLDNEGSSPNPGSLAYRGTAPFSEPETASLRDFINSRNFVLSLDYHAYGNVFLYPWGTDYYDGDGLTPDDITFQMISDSMATSIEQVYGTEIPYGTGWQLYYNTNGASFDWEYGDTTDHAKIIAIAPEVGTWDDGFWPSIARAESLKVEWLPANIFFARIAGELTSPDDLTVFYHSATNSLFFDWSPTGAPLYKLYSASSPAGPYDVLVTEVSSAFALIPLPDAQSTFYKVKSIY